jgi:hypothetical protein
LTKKLAKQVLVPATVRQIKTALQSEDFNLKKSAITKSITSNFSSSMKEGVLTTALERTFEPELPELARNILGDRVQVIERFAYPVNATSTQIEIELKNAPLRIAGSMEFFENGPATEIQINLIIEAHVPFFSEKIENYAQDIWSDISEKEFAFIVQWFTPQI